MKIAVFGDSYADETMNESIAGYPSWVRLLRKTYNLECFGKAASSLYYSYKLFLSKNSNFDKVVFVTTGPGRVEIPNYIKISNAEYKFVPNLVTAQNRLLHGLFYTEEEKKVLEAICMYYQYLIDFEKEKYLHRLMINDILNIRPDTILINGFYIDQSEPRLVDISKRELKTSGFPDEAFNWRDLRPCHFSKRTNEFVSEKVKSWIRGEPVKINVDEFPIIERREIEHLIKKT